MTVCFITNIVSPHQVPFAEEMVRRLGPERFRYVATEPFHAERSVLGWGSSAPAPWLVQVCDGPAAKAEADSWIEGADILLSDIRDLDLVGRRVNRGKHTLLMTERWFKPPWGLWRLLHPRYLQMACRFKALSQSPRFFYLPMGVPAAADVYRMVGLLSGRLGDLLRPPPVEPLARKLLSPFGASGRDSGLCRKWLLWGYFVAPAADAVDAAREPGPFRILWVGRMLNWKRAETIVEAVGLLQGEGRAVHLSLVGQGPEEPRIRKLAAVVNRARPAGEGEAVAIRPPVPIAEVRALMRASDAYVLSSSGQEGWGAVVNEAMEEGCPVIASRESGSGSTLIRDGETGCLFRSGDAAGLADQIRRLMDDPAGAQRIRLAARASMRASWSPSAAADAMVSFCEQWLRQ